MEQFAIFLLGLYLGFIQVIKTPQPDGTINHISIRVSCEVYTTEKEKNGPHGTSGHISSRVSFRVYIIP